MLTRPRESYYWGVIALADPGGGGGGSSKGWNPTLSGTYKLWKINMLI